MNQRLYKCYNAQRMFNALWKLKRKQRRKQFYELPGEVITRAILENV